MKNLKCYNQSLTAASSDIQNLHILYTRNYMESHLNEMLKYCHQNAFFFRGQIVTLVFLHLMEMPSKSRASSALRSCHFVSLISTTYYLGIEKARLRTVDNTGQICSIGATVA